jgi:dTDP-glucose pyrophosphorylase/predicted transcriptional regulator
MEIIKIWSEVLVKLTDNLGKVVQVLNDGGLRIVLVVDNDNKLQGTITDGDIRRALMSGRTMSSGISDVMNKLPITAKKIDSKEHILSLMNKMSILHIPIVDAAGVICGLETLQQLLEKPSYNNPVFLMAGGFGTRLHPLTKDIPKPLLKVGNKPILETIIHQFVDHGFHDFYISTHFKSELIRDYFKNGDQHGVSIRYVHEDTPLGTAGSLGLLPDNLPDLPIIVMNGDLLTKVDFKHLLDFHGNNNADATMCVREYDFQVPYGVVTIDKGGVREIKEKPIHKFFVNAGIYVLNRHLINKVDGESFLNMTDFLEKELNCGGVNAFPIHEYWLDIGRIEEYEKANQDVITIFNK